MDSFSLFLESEEDDLISGIKAGNLSSDRKLPILVYADWLKEHDRVLESCLISIMTFGRYYRHEYVEDAGISIIAAKNQGTIQYYTEGFGSFGQNKNILDKILDQYRYYIKADTNKNVDFKYYYEDDQRLVVSQRIKQITREKIPTDVIEEMTGMAERSLTQLRNNFPTGNNLKRFKGTNLQSRFLGVWRGNRVYGAIIKSFATVHPSRYLRLEPENGGKPFFIADPYGGWVAKNLRNTGHS